MRWQRFIMAAILVASFMFVVIALRSSVVRAEGDNSFPGLENDANAWIVNDVSPDRNLTYLYNGGGTDNGKTTHILRNRTLGRNEGTRLRVYYKRPPQIVRVTVNVNACQLEANGAFAGRVRVILGGEWKYDQPTQGKKVEEQKNYYHWVADPGAGPNQKKYVLGFWKSERVDADRADRNSPVCSTFPADYDVNRYIEGCNDPNANGTRCGGVGNNTFSKSGSDGTGTVPWNGAGYGDQFAVNNALNGKTFETAFYMRPDGKMGYDPNTRLYYADLDIDLTADADASAPGSGADPDMMQRITFKVKGEDAFNGSTWMNARMGYRFFADEDNAARFFGLQGNGGSDNRYPGWGQKHALPFGPDCDGTDRNGKITLYDPDRGGYGEVYMTVLRRNPETGNVVQLSGGDYFDGTNVDSAYGGKVLRSTAAGSGSRSSFSVRMEVGFQYMLAVFNPNQSPPYPNPPSSNVYSIRLPTDSMNGLVNCRYDLVPSINGVRPTFSGYGDSLSGTGAIVNTNPDASSGDHNWKISKVVYSSRPSDLSRTGVENSVLDPCQFAASKPGSQLSCDPDLYDATYPQTESHTFTEGVGPYPIGTYVCYFTSVLNPTWRPDDNNQRRYSNMQCSVAGIMPKVQAWGYDTKATGRIKTSLSDVSGRRYGSWAEYGLLSNGANTGMASGNGLLGGVGAGTTQTYWSPLTFASDAANAFSCPGGFGCYGGVAMPNVSVQDAVTAPGGGDYTVNSYAQLQGLLGGSKGKLRVNGTLFIADNLIYPDSTTGIAGIPKIELIANDIVINRNVQQIDPWVIAVGTNGSNGRVSTCDEAAQAGNYFVPMSSANLYGGPSGICRNPLKFNSPVIADKVYLYRTYDEQNGARAAETLNVRADNFLSSYVGGGTTQPVATTDAVVELPPRF